MTEGKLFITWTPYNINADDTIESIESEMCRYGRIIKVVRVKAGIIITYADNRDAEDALREMDRRIIGDVKILVGWNKYIISDKERLNIVEQKLDTLTTMVRDVLKTLDRIEHNK